MAVYLVATLAVHDVENFKPYIAAVPPIVEKYGGRFLVRGGDLRGDRGRVARASANRRGVAQHGAGEKVVELARVREVQSHAERRRLVPTPSSCTDTPAEIGWWAFGPSMKLESVVDRSF